MHDLLDFGGSEGVLRYIQEKSDDIERVVIPLYHIGHFPPTADYPGYEFEDVGLILLLINGHKQLIHKVDAEAVLNDGILNRMRIKISYHSPNDGPSI